MHRDAVASDITLSSRYECKYLVSPLVVPAIRAFAESFLEPDPYAALRTDRRYPICSLYLDSDDLRMYEQTVAGEKDRFKLRVRTYGDGDSKVFFEVKRRYDGIVRKRRAAIDRARALRFLEGTPAFAIGEDAALSDLLEFERLRDWTEAKPVLRIRYDREAYASRAGDPVRLTLDSNLMHAVTLGPELHHEGARWVSTPIGGVILEIKFTERYPGWVQDLVRTFGLKQQPVPKYALSLDHVLLTGRESTLALGGFVLPLGR